MIQALVPTVRAALERLGRPYLSKERIDMLDLLVLGILLFVGYAIYKSGKRVGSRKAYHVGFVRSRCRW
jgi:hypothetical protein